jgi:hypothetical protein
MVIAADICRADLAGIATINDGMPRFGASTTIFSRYAAIRASPIRRFRSA